MTASLKSFVALVVLGVLLVGCGSGGSGDSVDGTLRAYAGTLVGPGCVTGEEEAMRVLSLTLLIDDFSAGSSIFVEDATGAEWFGLMSSSSSFTASDQADSNEQISGSDMTPSTMNATMNTCLIADCCVRLEGQLTRP